MKLKVKDMDISAGGSLVVLLNEKDAGKFDLYVEDRIKVKKGNKETIAILDIAESRKAVAPGEIGLFEEVLSELDAKQGDTVYIEIEEKPKGISYISKKLDGKRLSAEEIDEIIKELVDNELSQIELTYFIAACYVNNMDIEETVALTKAIVKYGAKLNIKNHHIMDKHCSGGVPGNRTTMVLVPIVAAAGLTIPKTSSRSITSPAGTADTMEVLAPVTFSVKKMEEIVEKTNACIVWGGGVNLAAADDKLIRLRRSLSLDPEGMLLSSILAKKAAVNADHVLIDIPIGKDTKIKNKKMALHLKKEFIRIGKRLGMKIKVIITDGTEPIGNGIGPALEARDVLKIFRRDETRPLDLERKGLYMASLLMQMAGIKNAKTKARKLLESGEAYKKLKEIIKAQGGNPDIKPEDIPIGKLSYTLKASKSGRIIDIDNFAINKIARIAGAPKDKGAGIYLYKHELNKVKKGEDILTIYSKNPQELKFAVDAMKKLGTVVIR